MTNERHEAYKRALAMIDRKVAKLHPSEQELLRDSAEGLLLCFEADCAEATRLRVQAREKLAALVECDRWTSESAADLRAEIEGCCPEPALV